MYVEVPVKDVLIVPPPPEGEVKKAILDTERKNVNIITQRGESAIVLNKDRECCICGRKTNRYDITYRAYYCSDKCLAVEDKRFEEWLKEDINKCNEELLRGGNE